MIAGELWVVGIAAPDFYRTHRPLDIVEGFDMASCNHMLGESLVLRAKSFSF